VSEWVNRYSYMFITISSNFNLTKLSYVEHSQLFPSMHRTILEIGIKKQRLNFDMLHLPACRSDPRKRTQSRYPMPIIHNTSNPSSSRSIFLERGRGHDILALPIDVFIFFGFGLNLLFGSDSTGCVKISLAFCSSS
jgi:hypothetical protein